MAGAYDSDRPTTIGQVLDAMRQRIDEMPAERVSMHDFLSTYRRTTAAVGGAIDQGTFLDGAWVEEWDVAFARLYLDALDAELSDSGTVPRPWRLAFRAPAALPPLRYVLLGINAHINYDLPQALLAVISDEDFANPRTIARRRHDHEQIDGVLAGRVSAEDDELGSKSTTTITDRLLQPLNRRATRRFLTEARRKVWHNTTELQSARLRGPQDYAERLAELELLSAAKIADLLAPGQVLLRLAVSGFGVVLPPPRGA